MIDEACGYVPGAKADTVILECSMCHEAKVAGRHPSDPNDAAKVLFPCPKCQPNALPGTKVEYRNAEGERIIPSWEAEG